MRLTRWFSRTDDGETVLGNDQGTATLTVRWKGSEGPTVEVPPGSAALVARFRDMWEWLERNPSAQEAELLRMLVRFGVADLDEEGR